MTMIRVSLEMMNDAKKYSKAYSRTPPKQIEFWARIGKIAEDNPDLTFSEIKETLLSLSDLKEGKVDAYKFSS